MMVLRGSEHTFFENGGFTKASAPFSEPKGVRFRGGGCCLSVWVFSHVREKACPRLGGSAFFESRQRDLGVSSKAHKFACELRALLASDKHLGSAERSERKFFQQETRQRVPEAVWRISVRFAEATALPCVQNMRGARVMVFGVFLVLFGF